MESMTLEQLHDWHIGQQNLYRAKMRAGGVVPSKRNWSLLADFHGAAANAINYRDMPVKAKGEASAGIPEWVEEAASSIYDYFCLTLSGVGRKEFIRVASEIILKHAPKEEFRGITYDELLAHAKEQKATIAMLTQQLCDKKEIIRRLTT